MADNTKIKANTDGDTVATDDISGVKYQRIKLIHGIDGANDGDVSTANGLPVTPSTYATDDTAMPVTPKIMPVGGEYRATDTTYTDGDATVMQTDINGFTRTREQYVDGFVDNTHNKARVEHDYTPSAVAVADVQILGNSGFLHSVTISCNDAAPTAGSIIIYNNTAESGVVVFNHTFTTTPFMPFTVLLDYEMSLGIYIGFTTTGDVNVSCSYRSD